MVATICWIAAGDTRNRPVIRQPEFEYEENIAKAAQRAPRVKADQMTGKLQIVGIRHRQDL